MIDRVRTGSNAVLDAALLYTTAYGWSVFPTWGRQGDVCACGDPACEDVGKHPLGALVGHGFKDATCDPDTIRSMWGQYPDAGIAAPAGAGNGFILLDIDQHGDKDGLLALGPLLQKLGPLPETLCAVTPNGTHESFTYAEGIRNSAGKLGVGLDIRSDGGYVILPPSHGLYRWANDLPIAPLPEAWINHLRELHGPTGGAFSGPPEADAAEIAKALAVIPNELDKGWSDWNDIGMACFRATGGSEEGFRAFDAWSKKCSKYDPDTTHERWESYRRSPPNRIGAGTIFYMANQAAPGWRSGIAPDDERLLDELAKLHPIVYAKRRKDAAEQMGITPISALDKEVERRRQEADVAQATYLQPHWQVEPWPQLVDTRELLEAVEDQIKCYVATLGERAIVPALWVILSWLHEHATHSPILLLTSGEANSGKTTLADVIGLLVRCGLTSVGITGPALFRSIVKWQPTFVIDEADKAFAKNDDLREVINSGWTRNQCVVRCHPETHEPFAFSTFAPKCVAMKGIELPDTTRSRSLILVLKRKAPDETVTDFEHLDTPKFVELRSKLARWSIDNAELLQTAKPDTFEFDNRRRMNWRHLLAIAELAGDEVKKRVWNVAREMEKLQDQSPSLGTQLLSDIRSVFTAGDATILGARDSAKSIYSRSLINELIRDVEKPWADYKTSGKPITQKQLSVLLKAFGISSGDVGPSGERGKGYRQEQFTDAWRRYLPSDGAGPGGAKQHEPDEQHVKQHVKPSEKNNARENPGAKRASAQNDGKPSSRADFDPRILSENARFENAQTPQGTGILRACADQTGVSARIFSYKPNLAAREARYQRDHALLERMEAMGREPFDCDERWDEIGQRMREEGELS